MRAYYCIFFFKNELPYIRQKTAHPKKSRDLPKNDDEDNARPKAFRRSNKNAWKVHFFETRAGTFFEWA